MPYGVPGKQIIYRKEADEIKSLLDEIGKIEGLTNIFQYGEMHLVINKADRKYLNLINEVADRVISLANLSNQNDIPLVNRTYFKPYGYDVKEALEMFLNSFEFYKNIDSTVNDLLIDYAEKIFKRFRMGKKDTIKYITYTADAYFDIGEEKKAVDIMNKLIDQFPTYDEPYQVMLNWYMYKAKNISKIEKVVKKANSKNHRLVSGDFAYTKLVEYYEDKDDEKYAYYRKLHKKFLSKS